MHNLNNVTDQLKRLRRTISTMSFIALITLIWLLALINHDPLTWPVAIFLIVFAAQAVTIHELLNLYDELDPAGMYR